MVTEGAPLCERVILFARLRTLKWSKSRKEDWERSNIAVLLLVKIKFQLHFQGCIFESDSRVGFKRFETKVCHILSHNGGSLKGTKKKIALASHQRPISTWAVNVSIMKCSTVRKKEVPVLTVFHMAIHRRPETLYPEPYTTAVCQPSRNTKQTQNNSQTTGDSKERRKKEESVWKSEDGDDSYWLAK